MSIIFSADLFRCEDKFELSKPLNCLRERQGNHVFGYQWTVLSSDRQRRVLSGVSDNPYQRLSTYIAEFNRSYIPNKIVRGLPSLHQLVLEKENEVSLAVFGPYSNETSKEVEEYLIQSVPKEERLNRTRGGNGGSSWSQYDDLPPSVGVFTEVETPKKYYPLRRTEDGRITVELTPSAAEIKGGVYCFKELKNPGASRRLFGDKTPNRYVGLSTDVRSRIRVHSSLATHHPENHKLYEAISEDPENWGVGVFPSTTNLSPRTLRRAEMHHVDRLKPSMNSRRGGGGPAPMRKRKRES